MTSESGRVTGQDFISGSGTTIASRNAAAPSGKPRTWGMLYTVTNDPTPANNDVWILKYNAADTNLLNNANWVLASSVFGGGGGTVQPNFQIVYGTGTGITSSVYFQYDTSNVNLYASSTSFTPSYLIQTSGNVATFFLGGSTSTNANKTGIFFTSTSFVFYNTSSATIFTMNQTGDITFGGPSIAGANKTILADGSATNVGFIFTSKGTGNHQWNGGAFQWFAASGGAYQYSINGQIALDFRITGGTPTLSFPNDINPVITGAAGTGVSVSGNIIIRSQNSVAASGLGTGNLYFRVGTPDGAGIKGDIFFGSNIKFENIGDGLTFKAGANARAGVATLAAGTITVANTTITANTRAKVTVQETGANTGNVRMSAKVVGTSFTISSTVGTDTCVVYWELVELN